MVTTVKSYAEEILTGACSVRTVAGGDGGGHDMAGRVMSGSASTESMARLEQLRYDSYAGRAGWEPGRQSADGGGGSLDDIDYMSEEEEGADEADLSADELGSGSDSLRPSYRGGRRAHTSLPSMSLLRLPMQHVPAAVMNMPRSSFSPNAAPHTVVPKSCLVSLIPVSLPYSKARCMICMPWSSRVTGQIGCEVERGG